MYMESVLCITNTENTLLHHYNEHNFYYSYYIVHENGVLDCDTLHDSWPIHH